MDATKILQPEGPDGSKLRRPGREVAIATGRFDDGYGPPYYNSRFPADQGCRGFLSNPVYDARNLHSELAES
ncbi:hypothetical protein FDECE_13996 [Fusarium decemcellulare]|nr:hypothetical protein FDECE_13996 [Fusarium decemcellulare]